MSFLHWFRRDPMRLLAEHKAEVELAQRVRAEQELQKIDDLPLPDLKSSAPRLYRGHHAYILVPDAANNATDDVHARRQSSRFEELLRKLNAHRSSAAADANPRLEAWPLDYVRRDGVLPNNSDGS